jgi:hypothetical protein
VLTPRQRMHQRNAQRTALNAPNVPAPTPEPKPPVPVVPPAPYDNDEWEAVGFNRTRSLWWSVERVEIHGGERKHVLIAQVRSEETVLRILASQRWQTIGRKWRCRTHSNWAEPRVIS